MLREQELGVAVRDEKVLGSGVSSEAAFSLERCVVCSLSSFLLKLTVLRRLQYYHSLSLVESLRPA